MNFCCLVGFSVRIRRQYQQDLLPSKGTSQILLLFRSAQSNIQDDAFNRDGAPLAARPTRCLLRDLPAWCPITFAVTRITSGGKRGTHLSTRRHVRFEYFTPVTMQNSVFWDIKTQFVLHTRHITSPLQSPASY
jgi:hypothetical protein